MHRKALLERPEIGVDQIGTDCFDPIMMWHLLFLEKGWINLREWLSFIPERFFDEALYTAYEISQRSTFKRRIANVRILEYFIVVFHRQVEIAYSKGFLTPYGWISEFQPIERSVERSAERSAERSVERSEQLRSWDKKVHCKPYSAKRKCPKIAFRKRKSKAGLRLRRVKRLRKKSNG